MSGLIELDNPSIARNALNHMKDEMRHNLPLLGFADYEEQVDICLGVADRFKWYKRFVCPLPVCFDIDCLTFYPKCISSFPTMITVHQ